mmetsp:Transcript_67622/g.109691  ORF Transcript_67622/g.109691 Transcript_67622/m.109691 type:complete len:206 (+) Transcript_67622:299-916(+)
MSQTGAEALPSSPTTFLAVSPFKHFHDACSSASTHALTTAVIAICLSLLITITPSLFFFMFSGSRNRVSFRLTSSSYRSRLRGNLNLDPLGALKRCTRPRINMAVNLLFTPLLVVIEGDLGRSCLWSPCPDSWAALVASWATSVATRLNLFSSCCKDIWGRISVAASNSGNAAAAPDDAFVSALPAGCASATCIVVFCCISRSGN